MTFWPGSNGSTVTSSPTLSSLGAEVLVAELDQGAHRGGAGLLQVAELGLGQLALGDLVEGELDGRVAVALGVADRGDRAGAGLDHGDRDATVPSSVKTWVMPSFLPMIAAMPSPRA